MGSGWSNNSGMMVDGKLPDAAKADPERCAVTSSGPDFFHTLGVPVLEGRDFADSDTATRHTLASSTRSSRNAFCRIRIRWVT